MPHASALPRPSPADAQVEALARLSTLSTHLGAVALDLLTAAIVMEESWAQLGRRYRVDSRTAKSWCCAAIRALAAMGRP
jgi:hypothetical protein